MSPVFGYHPTTNRNTLQYGLPTCTSVTFNPAGDFKPVAFGVEIDGMRYRYKLKSANINKDKNGVYAFDCEYVDLGRIKTVRLIFDVIRCRWTVG